MSVGELAVIGAVALIVIGPEKLPTVARTLGSLLGRLQRYVASVKADIGREIELDNLRRLEQQMKEAGQQLRSEIEAQAAEIPAALADPSLQDDVLHPPVASSAPAPHRAAPERDRR